MKIIKYTNTFEKDLKTVRQYKGYNEKKLKEYIKLLADGRKLPEQARDHALSKSSPKHYQGMRDFHLSPDICVIYDISESQVALRRIGKHNKLGLTEQICEKLILSI